MQSIDSVTPTLCRLMQIPTPSIASAEPLKSVLEAGTDILDGEPVEKCLVYLPDAIGEYLYRDYVDAFEPVERLAPIQVEVESVSPSYTPVCFASMFSGARPEAHGITRYEKPVLTIDTIFDALSRKGKKATIVAVKDCSMDIIFRERSIDYYTEPYDPEVRNRVLNLIDEGDHDFIVAYQQEYDDVMHRTTPRSEEALGAFRRLIEGFQELSQPFLEANRDRNRLVGFFPDHGTHVDPSTGRGSHGTDSPEDMRLRHFWGIYRGE
jgi:hypothetical protein